MTLEEWVADHGPLWPDVALVVGRAFPLRQHQTVPLIAPVRERRLRRRDARCLSMHLLEDDLRVRGWAACRKLGQHVHDPRLEAAEKARLPLTRLEQIDLEA